MRTLRCRRPVVVVAVGLALALTGCTAASDPGPDPTSTTEAAPVDPPTEPEPVEEPGVGDEIDEEQVEQVREAGLGTYAFLDGTIVVVDPTEPLPAEVVKDLKEQAGVVAVADSDADSFASKSDRRSAVVIAARATTGKHIIPIVPGGHYDEHGNLLEAWFIFAAYQTPLEDTPQRFSTPAEAIEGAKAAIATQPNPKRYEIVDLTK